ncbi:(2Fe-2S)-binding protein [Pseudomonas sp. GV071]|jgi:xanthine dehydrogenase YagT iron-sulfur-binding subunit|uniref:(2Fe-2S)-binding protein n=1 Tax=Pseudomonas sp. GV071 TaxID=2135754 RepID=UPI000D379B44|nr:(2Fe-2S)-binding protein [Pseudomonas sp. GV071]PTQ68257.1 xanthine dehydrogenase YagT iron-sulfur-binding subunit [Pseudomonas sp. GV071]
MTTTQAGQGDDLFAPHTLRLNINGEQRRVQVQAWTTLLDLLREQLHLTGTKKGCDHGQCGACTVLLDGKRINSCLTLAVMHDGAELTTIEGVANGDELHALQRAFIKHDAFQCGYCTPGQICSALAMAGENHAHSRADIREQMSGNLCRCGAYNNILAAIEEALPACRGELETSAPALIDPALINKGDAA